MQLSNKMYIQAEPTARVKVQMIGQLERLKPKRCETVRQTLHPHIANCINNDDGLLAVE